MENEKLIEDLGQNKLKLTLEIGGVDFRKGIEHAYKRSKHLFNIPGFRKGKAPRQIIERMYGKDVFHEDAINHVLPDIYEKFLKEHDIEPVYRPEIDLGDVTDDGAFVYATIYTAPEAEIDNYLGLTYPKRDLSASEEEVQDALRKEQEKNTRRVSVERPAELGDVAVISFTGFIDGEEFEGGHSEEMDLELGKKQFIDTFEEQLVGANVGDDITVNVTFPEDYHEESLAGKPAVFEVEILDLQKKELPELNDDFAQDVSEFETLAEYREDIAKKITESKTATNKNETRKYLAKKLIDLSIVDVPEAMYEARIDDMFYDFARQIESQGMNIENYMRFTGMAPDQLRNSWMPQAQNDVKTVLALTAVAKKENINISDEEFETKISEANKKEGEELKKLIDSMPDETKKEMKKQMLIQKAMDFIVENAVAVDEPLNDIIETNIQEEE